MRFHALAVSGRPLHQKGPSSSTLSSNPALTHGHGATDDWVQKVGVGRKDDLGLLQQQGAALMELVG